jgi:Flp pilus assembly protein TadG
MRWLRERLSDERGGTAVLVGLLMVPLIGCLAIALDVGALYAERAQLQNGADAAALAVARNCASTGSCAGSAAIAQTFADANANDAAAAVDGVTFPTARSARVVTSTRADGTNVIRHPFASIIGIDSSTVRAEATAEWGSPRASELVLPLAVSLCEFTPALTGALQLIRYDQNVPNCERPAGHPIPGGFGWLDLINGQCASRMGLGNTTLFSDTGNNFPGVCSATMASIIGTTIVVPIFDDGSGNGANGTYNIHGFAAFTVTGWKLGGSPELTNTDAAAPSCTGNCRGIQGRFVRWVSLADGELGAGPDLGVSIVRLSR